MVAKFQTCIVCLITAVLCMGILSWPSRTLACGPFFPRAITVYRVHPDPNLSAYAAGNIGVIQPTYARSYLLVAYRYLAGDPLDSEQRKAVEALWGERLGVGPDFAALPNDETTTFSQDEHAWQSARAQVVSTPGPQFEDYTSVNFTVASYVACLQDSLRNSTETLAARIEKFGAGSPEIKDWVQAQDAVYSNCNTQPQPQFPSLAKSGYPAILQADRAYQIGAAYFYAEKFDEAVKTFQAIASDPKSPWSTLAPYLVARALVRKATLTAEPGKTDMAVLAQAEAQLTRVLADKRLESIHPAAQRLMNLVRFRLRPDDRLQELAQEVTQKTHKPGFKQSVCDFTLLMDNFQKENYQSTAEAAKKADVTDWIFAFQARDSLDHCIQKWTQTHSTPWLVASMAKAGPNNPNAERLLTAAKSIGKDSPAYIEVTFQSARLMILSGKLQEARTLLDAVLGSHDIPIPASAQNQLLTERMFVATSLDDCLKHATRTASAVTEDADDRELPDDLSDNAELKALAKAPVLDSSSAALLDDRLPLTVLQKAATSGVLPERLQHELALGAWVRAVILGNEAVAHDLAPVLKTDFPDLTKLIDYYLAAHSPDEKLFAAIFLMLGNPGARPYVTAGLGRGSTLDKLDSYRNNWWCAYTPGAWVDYPTFYLADPERPKIETNFRDNSLGFLSPAEKAAAAAELKRLTAIPAGPNYLCAQVIDWARKKPDDPRLPEALHLAVRSTRWGCTDKETGKLSKEAFDILHKRYPETSWAKDTKYWYAN